MFSSSMFSSNKSIESISNLIFPQLVCTSLLPELGTISSNLSMDSPQSRKSRFVSLAHFEGLAVLIEVAPTL